MTDGIPRPMIHALIEEYAPLLYRYAYRLTGNSHEAEDLTQQTFLLAQQRGHQLRDAGAIRGWLLTIVRNAFLKSRRHRGKWHSLDQVDEPRTHDEQSESTAIDSEQLQQALLELNEEFRSPIVLYYFEDFSYQQIAEHMGVPIGTVMSRLSRAKAFLKKRLSPPTESTDQPSINFKPSPTVRLLAAASHR